MREWLVARPVAHRGLHDAAAGIIENTPSAFKAAVAANYAIECDIQISADGEAMVFHDHTLDRLTEASGRVDAFTAAELKRVAFRATADRMITLGELCDLAAYSGHAALMSFDPAPIAALQTLAPRLPRGIVAERRSTHSEGNPLPARTKHALAYFHRALRSRPQFIAYSVADLPSAIPWLARNLLRVPLLTWTVRTDVDRKRAARYADQMIFEGFRP